MNTIKCTIHINLYLIIFYQIIIHFSNYNYINYDTKLQWSDQTKFVSNIKNVETVRLARGRVYVIMYL